MPWASTRGFFIIDPNSRGKSALIRMISTLLIPDEGDVKVNE